MTQSKPSSLISRLPQGMAPALLGLLMAVPLAACGVDRRATIDSSAISADYRDTHPIVLSDAPRTVDIFPTGGGLDLSSSRRVREFAERYSRLGQGELTILMPNGGSGVHNRAGALAAIRRELLSGGARGSVSIGSYPIADPSLAAPFRLAFTELRAKVGTSCGQWPTDLLSGSSLETWQNRPYYNFGCATQNMIAAQVDDPRDLVSPRGETPADTEMRSRAIQNVRKGVDPGTTWITRNSTISSIGSN